MNWNLITAGKTLYGECRGEPLDGQLAVAWNLKNRLRDGRWGSTIGAVCLWHNQYSCWRSDDPNFQKMCRLPDDDPVLAKMVQIMESVMASDDDPTEGALFYYARTLSPAPAWSATMRFCGQHGNQYFFSDRKKVNKGALTS